MDLDAEKKMLLQAYVEAGLSLSEIQVKLEQEEDWVIRFMDLRFLIDDLGLKLAEQPSEVLAEELPLEAGGQAGASDQGAGASDQGAGASDQGAAPTEAVRVELDRVKRPNAAFSGNVTFSDGVKMGWQVDGMGRLGLLPGSDPTYRPCDEDLLAFQNKLSELLK